MQRNFEHSPLYRSSAGKIDGFAVIGHEVSEAQEHSSGSCVRLEEQFPDLLLALPAGVHLVRSKSSCIPPTFSPLC
jgi:hypothetical protein